MEKQSLQGEMEKPSNSIMRKQQTTKDQFEVTVPKTYVKLLNRHDIISIKMVSSFKQLNSCNNKTIYIIIKLEYNYINCENILFQKKYFFL